MLTVEHLRSILEYDPARGVFLWRGSPARTVRAGAVAGGTNSGGYTQIKIEGVKHLASRLVVLYLTGSWPIGVVDHINGVKKDNRAQNLRDTTGSVNQQNITKARSTSRSKILGVHMAGTKYASAIRLGTDRIWLGVFSTAEDAERAYLLAKSRLHAGAVL